ncbi:MAG: hypothetical protein DRG27_06470 [Deltaproteobacteria bacterium]|nr:MAG: hypothetical protein DRG27_06470 [Deltaproteobacteria bacterium]
MHKLLKDVDEDKVFYLKSGKVIKNLNQLLTEARRISADDFNHHVGEERNDFSNWVMHVLGDRQLAGKISLIKNKNELVSVLQDAINKTKKLIKPKQEIQKNKLSGNKMKAKKVKKTKATKKTAKKAKSKPGPIVKETAKKPAKRSNLKREIFKVKDKPSNKKDISKIDEILRREEKILEIEQLLEEKMQEFESGKKYKIEEFVQGLLLGVIVGFIIGLLLITL